MLTILSLPQNVILSNISKVKTWARSNTLAPGNKETLVDRILRALTRDLFQVYAGKARTKQLSISHFSKARQLLEDL